MEEITTRHAGMFQPGQSGNPAGRPKQDRNIRDLARAHTQEAFETLIEIAGNPKTSPSARVQACNSILDRGWGRPVQTNKNINRTETYYDFLMKLVKEDKRGTPSDLLD